MAYGISRIYMRNNSFSGIDSIITFENGVHEQASEGLWTYEIMYKIMFVVY